MKEKYYFANKVSKIIGVSVGILRSLDSRGIIKPTLGPEYRARYTKSDIV